MNETQASEKQKEALPQIQQRVSLVSKFANRYSIEPNKLMTILKATCFSIKEGEVTDEQMAALLVVADQYGLNPFTREIFAFPDKKNGIVPVVGVDGWSRIINDNEQCDGFEFRQSDKIVTLPDAKPCPEWMEVVIYRKDRSHPTVVREYLGEVYKPLGTYKDGNKMSPGAWQTHTTRFLRHKTLIQGARITFGYAGIYDEDEALRIIEHDVTPPPAQLEQRSGVDRLKTAMDLQETVIQDEKKPIEETKAADEPKKLEVPDCIAELDKYADLEAMALWADTLDNEIKVDPRFTKAYRLAMNRIKGKG